MDVILPWTRSATRAGSVALRKITCAARPAARESAAQSSSDIPRTADMPGRLVPPDVAFLAVEFSRGRVEPLGAVLHHQRLRISLDVEIPVRMLRSTALRAHHGVLALVLYAHQRK